MSLTDVSLSFVWLTLPEAGPISGLARESISFLHRAYDRMLPRIHPGPLSSAFNNTLITNLHISSSNNTSYKRQHEVHPPYPLDRIPRRPGLCRGCTKGRRSQLPQRHPRLGSRKGQGCDQGSRTIHVSSYHQVLH